MWLALRNFCPHQLCITSGTSAWREQGCDSSILWSMIWVTDSERMIDDHPTQPITMTAETWKERKNSMEYSNDRAWRYHGMSGYALKIRSAVLHLF